MAITQLNPNAGLLDYEAMLETLIATYTGKPTITLTNYDNDSAPQVTAGSIFENNGTLFSNDALATPTGYAGISNSTTFYLYYNVSTGAFIYSETVPVWSDAKQGWYNSNDRAFFSMFKDSGGTLYQYKSLLLPQNNLRLEANLQVMKGIRPVYFRNITGSNSGVLYSEITDLFPTIDSNPPVTMIGTIFLTAQPDIVHYIGYARRTSATNIRIQAIAYDHTGDTISDDPMDIADGGSLDIGWAMQIL